VFSLEGIQSIDYAQPWRWQFSLFPSRNARHCRSEQQSPTVSAENVNSELRMIRGEHIGPEAPDRCVAHQAEREAGEISSELAARVLKISADFHTLFKNGRIHLPGRPVADKQQPCKAESVRRRTLTILLIFH